MTKTPDILCIGAILWDLVGRTELPMRAGDDRPGRIARAPGGVAMNVARALAHYGMRPAMLGVVGRDSDGEALIAACGALGIDTAHVLRREDLPTDRYMAIESRGALVAALADAHSLEAAGEAILEPLADGRLGSAGAPYAGAAVLDGNLTEAMLGRIAASPLLARADLRIAPASPGKAVRLKPFLGLANATLYLNLREAALLAGAEFDTSADAARALVRLGAARALVTAGEHATADACGTQLHVATPPPTEARRVTGAGDTFMAAHIAAEREGHRRDFALAAALQAAATHVAGVDA